MKDRKNGARYGKGDNSMTRIPVAVLGATGMVGQRFIELLQGHPWFELVGLAASEQRAGRPYKDVAQWRLAGSDMPAEVANLPVIACKPEALPKKSKLSSPRSPEKLQAKSKPTSHVPEKLCLATPRIIAWSQTCRYSFPRSTPITRRPFWSSAGGAAGQAAS